MTITLRYIIGSQKEAQLCFLSPSLDPIYTSCFPFPIPTFRFKTLQSLLIISTMAIDRHYQFSIAFAWSLFLQVAYSANLVAETPKANEIVPVDQPYNITWYPGNAPGAATVSINLNNNDGSASLLTGKLEFPLALRYFPLFFQESQGLLKRLMKPARV